LLARDTHQRFGFLIERIEIVVGDGPVGSDAKQTALPEVFRRKARRPVSGATTTDAAPKPPADVTTAAETAAAEASPTPMPESVVDARAKDPAVGMPRPEGGTASSTTRPRPRRRPTPSAFRTRPHPTRPRRPIYFAKPSVLSPIIP
jgi:hypothetical protein